MSSQAPGDLLQTLEAKNDASTWTPDQWLGFIQLIEQLGGSQGLKNSINEGKFDKQAAPPIETSGDAKSGIDRTDVFAKSVGASCKTAGLLINYFTISTDDGHSGSAVNFGFSFGASAAQGALGYETWDHLKSANKYVFQGIASGAGGFSVQFFHDSTLVGVFAGVAEGVQFSTNWGKWKWDH